MSSLSFSSGHQRIRLSEIGAVRLAAARALGVTGVVAYNWWVVVPFVPGLMPSYNGFFSDLEASGRPHAALMEHADLVAGISLLLAFLLRGSMGRHGRRSEWRWMVAFAVAGGIGGRYPYACAEGLSAACRSLEWHLELPVHHYIHVVSGIAEFVTLTVAVVLATRRSRGEATLEARVFRTLLKVLVVAYPLLGLVYLTDRLGAFVEPVFFLVFSVMIITELFEPKGREVTPLPAGTPAESVSAAPPG